ncbi:putative leucine-rich repeat-containing protein DDB_G0290503 [Chrysoperla carnea]|uniref:putative leucine-rich repeat-containing protein DDB_G0290503 n=1 Tax=Chrysoperla carnea TaxID=189513 RepID=UPI001D0902F4|nr:putative leucine-rich repeat-containing protein DDB_G0290503 [Chrysoperla carnea]
MSYVHKRDRVFYPAGDAAQNSPRPRTNNTQLGQLIPIHVLLETLITSQTTEIDKLKQQNNFLKEKLQLYDNLQLTETQNAEIDVALNHLNKKEYINSESNLSDLEEKCNISDLEKYCVQLSDKFQNYIDSSDDSSTFCQENLNCYITDEQSVLKPLPIDIEEIIIEKESLIIALEHRIAALQLEMEDGFMHSVKELESLNKEISQKDILLREVTSCQDIIKKLQNDLNNSQINQAHEKQIIKEEMDSLKQYCNTILDKQKYYDEILHEQDEYNRIKHELDYQRDIHDKYKKVLSECDLLRIQVSEYNSLKDELNSLRFRAKEADCLRLERDQLQCRIENLTAIECEYLQLVDKTNNFDTIKLERDIYKTKMNELLATNHKKDLTISQLQLECKQLTIQLEYMAKEQDSQQKRTIDAFNELREEIIKKNKKIAFYEEQLLEFDHIKEEMHDLQNQIACTIESAEIEHTIDTEHEEKCDKHFEQVQNEYLKLLDELNEKNVQLEHTKNALIKRIKNLEYQNSGQIIQNYLDDLKNLSQKQLLLQQSYLEYEISLQFLFGKIHPQQELYITEKESNQFVDLLNKSIHIIYVKRKNSSSNSSSTGLTCGAQLPAASSSSNFDFYNILDVINKHEQSNNEFKELLERIIILEDKFNIKNNENTEIEKCTLRSNNQLNYEIKELIERVRILEYKSSCVNEQLTSNISDIEKANYDEIELNNEIKILNDREKIKEDETENLLTQLENQIVVLKKNSITNLNRCQLNDKGTNIQLSVNRRQSCDKGANVQFDYKKYIVELRELQNIIERVKDDFLTSEIIPLHVINTAENIESIFEKINQLSSFNNLETFEPILCNILKVLEYIDSLETKLTKIRDQNRKKTQLIKHSKSLNDIEVLYMSSIPTKPNSENFHQMLIANQNDELKYSKQWFFDEKSTLTDEIVKDISNDEVQTADPQFDEKMIGTEITYTDKSLQFFNPIIIIDKEVETIESGIMGPRKSSTTSLPDSYRRNIKNAEQQTTTSLMGTSFVDAMTGVSEVILPIHSAVQTSTIQTVDKIQQTEENLTIEKRVYAELNIQKLKEISVENIGSLKSQYHRDLHNIMAKHNNSVARLQQMHEDTLAECVREHERENDNLREYIKELRTKLTKYEISAEQEKIDESEKRLLSNKDTQRIVSSPNLAAIVDKILYEGIEQLTIQELTLLHARTCKVNKRKMTNENGSSNKDKYLTQLQILEQEIMRKQNNAIEELKNLEHSMLNEKEDLNELKIMTQSNRRSLSEHRNNNNEQKNSSLNSTRSLQVHNSNLPNKVTLKREGRKPKKLHNQLMTRESLQNSAIRKKRKT